MGFDTFIKRMCNQTAVHWQRTGSDGHGGSEYADPVEIDCRWDEVRELILSENGREIVSDAQVLVTQDISENDMLYLGSLDDLDSGQQADPNEAKAHKVRRFRKIPTIDGRYYKRIAYL